MTATVKGSSVTATTTVYSSPQKYSTSAGICVRDAAGGHFDFPKSTARLLPGGTTFTKTASFPKGTYTYWACAQISGSWYRAGAVQTFVVSGTTTTTTGATTTTPVVSTPTTTTPTTSTPTTSSSPSGQAMPVGDLTNWKQVFTDDFTTPLARGSFPGSYASKWTSYDGFYDTFKTGYYSNSSISMHDGAMDLYLRTENGRATVAAPVPVVGTAWKGQTYGRYSVRFKSDKLPGYKAAWLLWSEDDDWGKGEIDFPEGNLDGTIWGFNHCVGNPMLNCYWVDAKASFSDWHTATIEWSPGKLSYILDGVTLGTATNSVPTTPMKWILQTESNGSGAPSSSVAGSVLIDWVTIYSWKG